MGGLHTSWALASQGISDSLMHQDKRADSTLQEKGSEVACPNRSGGTHGLRLLLKRVDITIGTSGEILNFEAQIPHL